MEPANTEVEPSPTRSAPRKLGLNQVYPPRGDSSRKTNIDIVAIHGLDTGSPKTWVAWEIDGDPKSRHVHWLQDLDMLPSSIPDARIFTYDWNASFDSDAQTQGLLGHADKLLEKLQIKRSKDDINRPIIFVASCFGGLLLCRALNRASTEHSDYRSILAATSGIMFLGTPFQGTDGNFVKVIDMRLAVARTMGEENSELIRYLESTESRDLDDIVREFTEMANNIRHKLSIVCLYETRLTDFTGALSKLPDKFRKSLDRHNKGVLVPEKSACLTGYTRSGLDVRHSMLNKFAAPEDEAFETVAFYLNKLAKGAHQMG